MSGFARWALVSMIACLVVACGASNESFPDATGDARMDAIANGDATDAVSMDRAPFDGNAFDVQPIDVPGGDSPAPSGGGVDCGTPVTSVPYAMHTVNEEFTDPPTCSG